MADHVWARPADQALAVPATPANAVDGPSGFYPSRVRVTAADFNGHDWDGCPFSHVPGWLVDAMRNGGVTIAEDERDYALWAVDTPTGVKLAEPGDEIIRGDGFLEVERESYLNAIAMEARQGGDGETRLHAKHDSAGRKASPKGEGL